MGGGTRGPFWADLCREKRRNFAAAHDIRRSREALQFFLLLPSVLVWNEEGSIPNRFVQKWIMVCPVYRQIGKLCFEHEPDKRLDIGVI